MVVVLFVPSVDVARLFLGALTAVVSSSASRAFEVVWKAAMYLLVAAATDGAVARLIRKGVAHALLACLAKTERFASESTT